MSNDFNFDDFGDDDFGSFDNDLGGFDDFGDGGFDDFNLDAELGVGSQSDLPDLDDEDEGGNRTFVLLGIGLTIIFLLLVGVIAFLVLGQGDDELTEAELLATQNTAANQTTEAQSAASSTAVIINGTETAVAQETIDVENTQTAEAGLTQTQDAVNAFSTSTIEAQGIFATETQAAVFAEQTSIAQSATPEVTATSPPAQLVTTSGVFNDPETGQPAGGVTLCVFRDANGDGQIDVPADAPEECLDPAPVVPAPAGGPGGAAEDTGDDGADLVPEVPAETEEVGDDATPIPAPFLTATALADEEPNDSTAIPPSFLTATALAVTEQFEAEQEGDTTEGVAPTAETFSGPPSPTPEGSGFDSSERMLILQQPSPAAVQDPEPDEFVGTVTTLPDGSFQIDDLPPGDYVFRIANQDVEVEFLGGTQTVTVTGEDGETITITLQGPIAQDSSGMTPTALNPIFQTATARAQSAEGGPVTPTQDDALVSPAGPTEERLDDTGLFTEGDDVTGADLLILAFAGAALMAIVVTARRLRTA